MFRYNIFLASRGVLRHPVLSALMAVAVGLGIAMFMAIFTIAFSLSKNPLPDKKDLLYRVQLDAGDPNRQGDAASSRPHQLTYMDAVALMREGRAMRQSALFGTAAIIRPEGAEIPFEATGRAAYGDFFAMFDAPFKYGQAWTDVEDENRERVVVLSEHINDRLFGGENSIGEHITLKEELFRVVGVLDDWQLVPRVYDFNFAPIEDTFVPFTTAAEMEFARRGNTNCWQSIPGEGHQAFLASECIWIQYWVELSDPSRRASYLSFLDSYANQQKELGRFQRPLNNAIHTIDEWSDYVGAVDEGIWVTIVIALLFLTVCLINSIGLLLAKFLSRSSELAVHRAMGASRLQLFTRFLVESACIGFAGGLLGLFLAWMGLLGIRVLFRGETAISHVTHLDMPLAIATVVLAIFASLVASLYPAWRGSRGTPASLLRGL